MVAWLGNRYWSFRHRRQSSRGREFLLFVLMNVVAAVVAVACLAISHDVLGLTSTLADNISGNVIGVALGTLFRFWAYRTFVFTEFIDSEGRDRAEDPDAEPLRPGTEQASGPVPLTCAGRQCPGKHSRRPTWPWSRYGDRAAAARRQLTGQRGSRFSVNARTPSARSAENAVARHAASSISSAEARSTPAPSRIARLALRTPTGEWRAIVEARACAATKASPAGTTRSTTPSRTASSAFSRRAVKMSSAARAGPIRRGSSWVPPQARDDAHRHLGEPDDGRLVGDDEVAEQGELQAPTEGVAGDGGHHRHGDRRATRPPSGGRPHVGRAAARRGALRSLRSAPTQNARGLLDDRTTARRSSSAASAANTSPSSWANAVEMAFRASGRSRTTSATTPPDPASGRSRRTTVPHRRSRRRP